MISHSAFVANPEIFKKREVERQRRKPHVQAL
jgi:hypothetical protein